MNLYQYGDNRKNLVITIEQLKREINQKTHELNESLYTQYLLREELKSSTKTLGEIANRLHIIETRLKESKDYFYKLKQENLQLKLSCDVWLNRSIKLEFELQSARDAAKK